MKTEKNFIFWSFWALFVNYSDNKNYSRKSASITFFLFPGFYCCEKFLNKTTEKIKKKVFPDIHAEK